MFGRSLRKGLEIVTKSPTTTTLLRTFVGGKLPELDSTFMRWSLEDSTYNITGKTGVNHMRFVSLAECGEKLQSAKEFEKTHQNRAAENLEISRLRKQTLTAIQNIFGKDYCQFSLSHELDKNALIKFTVTPSLETALMYGDLLHSAGLSGKLMHDPETGLAEIKLDQLLESFYKHFNPAPKDIVLDEKRVRLGM